MLSLLNNALRRARLRYRPGKTLASVAEELGVKPTYLTKVETGHLTRPTREVLDKMFEVYGLSPATRAMFNEMFDAVEEGFIPRDDAIGADHLLANRLKLREHPGEKKHLLVCDLIPDIFKAGLKDQVALTTTAVILDAGGAGPWSNHFARDPDQRQVLYRYLLDRPDLVFMPDPARWDDQKDEKKLAVYGATQYGTLNKLCVEDLILWDYAFGVLDSAITAHEDEVSHFLEDFEQCRSLALPGDRAVAIVEMIVRSMDGLYDSMLNASWKVKRKGDKVIVDL